MARQKTFDVKKIVFANGNQAKYVEQASGASVDDMIKSLGVRQPETIIISLGGAKDLDTDKIAKLTHMYSRGVADAAEDLDALIIDGGTDSGVMAMMGQSLRNRKKKLALLGIAPEGKILLSDSQVPDETGRYPLEPHHSFFMLAKSNEWGGETDLMVEVAKSFSFKAQVVVVLANGGENAKIEMLRCVREGWPIIILKDSGRFADHLADLKEGKTESDDPIEIEIVETGDLHFFSLEESPIALKELVHHHGVNKRVLKQAWDRFFLYDHNATVHQKTFFKLQKSMLFLAVFGTFLAVVQTQLQLLSSIHLTEWQVQLFKFAIIIVPITVSVLLSVSNQLKSGNKWIFLRSGAEEIKQEIYKYRTRAGIYSESACKKDSREVKLALRLKIITRRVMKTEVNLAGLRSYDFHASKKYLEERALDELTPAQYVINRLDDQQKWYQKKTRELERQLNRLKVLVYVVGGAGTLLAAFGLELWIAVTTAIAGAVTTFLEYRQIENLLMSYNQTANDLIGIKDWWVALSTKDQKKNSNVDKLVTFTENTLSSENRGWVQHMQDMLDELQDEQTDNKEKE